MNDNMVADSNGQVVIKVLMATYNRVDCTISCLNSLFDSRLPPAVKIQVILVDAGSSDGTLTQVDALNRDIQTFTVSQDHYWAMSMRTAWMLAQRSPYSFLLWLNDDVILDEDAVQELLRISSSSAHKGAVLGAVRSAVTNEITYSGFRQESRMRPLKLTNIKPSGYQQCCDSLNGNVVLVPAKCDYSVGGFPKNYTHALADIAYGFELRKNGFSILLAERSLGICERQEAEQLWLDPSRSMRSRLSALRGPKGLPFIVWLKFCLRYGGPLGVLNAIKPYLKLALCSIKQAVRGYF